MRNPDATHRFVRNQNAFADAIGRSELGFWATPVEALTPCCLGLGARGEEQPLDAPRWICSALQAAALIVAGVAKTAPAGVRLTTPRDVAAMRGAFVLLGEPAALTKDT